MNGLLALMFLTARVVRVLSLLFLFIGIRSPYLLIELCHQVRWVKVGLHDVDKALDLI